MSWVNFLSVHRSLNASIAIAILAMSIVTHHANAQPRQTLRNVQASDSGAVSPYGASYELRRLAELQLTGATSQIDTTHAAALDAAGSELQSRDWDVDWDSAPVERFKKQAIQTLGLKLGSLWAVDNQDLSSQFAETSIGLGIPLGSLDRILGVTPSFRAEWIDAAPELGVPDVLYQTGVQLFYRAEINSRWSWMAIVQPAVRSDFSTRENAFRMFGLGLVNWQLRPDQLTLSMGVVYLDRADLPPLPALGLSWTPSPQSQLDLRFPESKWSWRIQKDGPRSETWCYLSAGIGGNTWAVSRPAGRPDELSLRDIRLQLGVDHVVQGGGGWFAQCGYAFNRNLEFASHPSEIPLSDALLLEAGWRY